MNHASLKPTARTRARGNLRIIGGQWRSRRIEVAALEGLRPTPDRVRQTLFDWLQHFWAGQGLGLSGMRVLDAFAGTGALGLEAGSRGAAEVLFIEQHPQACRVLAKNLLAFKSQALRLIEADAMSTMQALAQHSQPFDLVFLDPPFAAGLDVAAAASALALLNQGGLLYLESDRSWAQALEQTSGSSREQLASCLRLIRQAKAGAVHYHLLQRHNDSGQATS